MNWRATLIVSLGLNLVLGAVWLKNQSPGPVDVVGAELAGPSRTDDGMAAITTVTNEVERLIELPAGEVAWPAWAEIADENLLVQRTNLLAIGCPEGTVHDILSKTIERMKYQARATFMIPHLPRFWDHVASGGFGDNPGIKQIIAQLDEHLEPFDELETLVLAGLETGDRQLEDARERSDKARQIQNEFGHLSAEKQAEIIRLEDDLQQARAEKLEAHRSGRNGLTPEGREIASQLTREHREKLEALMTEEEKREWKLRTSGASEWAAHLRGFEPEGEELQQIAEWRMAFDEQHKLPNKGHESYDERLAARQAAEAAMEERTRELLGDERFARLQRASDEVYPSLYDVGLRFQMPEATINTAWQMQRDADAAARRIREDTSLTLVQRREGLRAIQQETQQSFQNLLGDEPYQTYRENGGNWLNELSRVNVPRN